MGVGRKRIPTEVKQLKGTLRHVRQNDNEPEYILVREMPEPPEYLSEVGRSVYYSTAEELLKLGILSRVSLSIFVMYCAQVAINHEANMKIKKSGLVIVDKGDNPKINPYVKVANDSLMAAVRIACEFGLTPASASKVNAVNVKENAKSDLMKYLNSK